MIRILIQKMVRRQVSIVIEQEKLHAEIVPVVLRALGTMPKTLAGNLRRLGIPDVIGCL